MECTRLVTQLSRAIWLCLPLSYSKNLATLKNYFRRKKEKEKKRCNNEVLPPCLSVCLSVCLSIYEASFTIMRRTFEHCTKARLSFSGGPHAPVNMADSMENAGSWTVSGSKEVMEVPKNFKDLRKRGVRKIAQYSGAHVSRMPFPTFFSTDIHFFQSTRVNSPGWDKSRHAEHAGVSTLSSPFNPFNPKLIMQILPTIQEENY